jgi:gas vesicle protein
MGDTVDALAYKADVKGRVKESIADKRDRLVEQIQGTKGKVGDAAPDTEQVKEGAREVVGVAQENPIGLAVGGLAAGFLVGMMLPSSKLEDERVGPLSDQVKETAVDTAEEAVDRGRRVATQVAEQAVEEAKEAGRHAVENAKEAGQQQTEELKASAREGAEEVRDQIQT